MKITLKREKKIFKLDFIIYHVVPNGSHKVFTLIVDKNKDSICGIGKTRIGLLNASFNGMLKICKNKNHKIY